MGSKSSTIRLSKECKKELQKLGEYGDTHESIVRRLIQHYKKVRRRGLTG